MCSVKKVLLEISQNSQELGFPVNFPVNFAEFSRAHESAKNTEKCKEEDQEQEWGLQIIANAIK